MYAWYANRNAYTSLLKVRVMFENLSFVCPWMFSIIVIDDQQVATILVYLFLFIPNQLYMFRSMYSPIIRSTWLYLHLLVVSTDNAAGRCHG